MKSFLGESLTILDLTRALLDNEPVMYNEIILLPREAKKIGLETLAAACEEGRIRRVEHDPQT